MKAEMEIINCVLRLDMERGVIYVDNPKTGATVLRVSKIANYQVSQFVESSGEWMIDVRALNVAALSRALSTIKSVQTEIARLVTAREK